MLSRRLPPFPSPLPLLLGALALTLLTQCREDLDVTEVVRQELPPTVELTTVSLAGHVHAPDGAAGVGATVEVLHNGFVLERTTAGADGSWSLDDARVPVGVERVTVRTRHAGAYPVVRSVELDHDATEYASARLLRRDVQSIQDVDREFVAERAGLAAEVQAGSLVDADGLAYDGEVRWSLRDFAVETQHDLAHSVAAPFTVLTPDGGHEALRVERLYLLDAETPDARPLRLAADAQPSTLELRPRDGEALYAFDDASGYWSELLPQPDGSYRPERLGYFATGRAATGARAFGRVVDEAGAPRAGVEVMGVPFDRDPNTPSTYELLHTDSEGRFSAVVPAGSFMIFFAAPGQSCAPGIASAYDITADVDLGDVLARRGDQVTVAGTAAACDPANSLPAEAYVIVTSGIRSVLLEVDPATGAFSGTAYFCPGEETTATLYLPARTWQSEPVVVDATAATGLRFDDCDAEPRTTLEVELPDGTVLRFARDGFAAQPTSGTYELAADAVDGSGGTVAARTEPSNVGLRTFTVTLDHPDYTFTPSAAGDLAQWSSSSSAISGYARVEGTLREAATGSEQSAAVLVTFSATLEP